MGRLFETKIEKEGIRMIDFIKKIWAGPFTVKTSFLFLLFVIIVMVLANPGKMIFAFGLLFAIFNILEWLYKEDE